MDIKSDKNGDNTKLLIPSGKIVCYITGTLREDTPEEHVRQRWARSLVTEYGYKKGDIAINFPIKMGRAKKFADIVIFGEAEEKKQENIFIIVEAKRADIKPSDKKQGIAQLKSYMAACLNCRYGLWVGELKEVYEKIFEKGLPEFAATYDIPRKGAPDEEIPKFTNLVQATDLKDTLRRCHNYISGNQGLRKEEAFHELLKLIFCKVQDERQSGGKLRFFVRNVERRSIAGQNSLITERIGPLFEEVKNRYQYIFPKDAGIKLTLPVLAYITAEFQRYSFLKTETDIKGEAYEELVGGNLRGERGEFFTPRDVCDMGVRMAFATYTENKIKELRVIDPACGTGGFLISVMNYWRKIFLNEEKNKWREEQKVIDETNNRLKETCDAQLFGVDITALLVSAAQMNLVMHGNGSMNVTAANSLLPLGEWPRNTEEERRIAEKIKLGSFDVVFTNPPFGSKIPVDDPHILGQFELSTFGAVNPRTSMPPEQVFIERCLQFLKPGGRLAIVLPDGILNNPGLVFIRKWLLFKTRVVASIDLPVETFAKYGGTRNTSVLLLQKKYPQTITAEAAGAELKYKTFMSKPRKIGYDLRGNPVYLRSPSGEEIIDPNTSQPIRERHLPIVATKFEDWIKTHIEEVLLNE